MYIDIESGEIITTEQLYTEYLQYRKADPESFDYSFSDYIKNCLAIHNGTLEKLN